LCSLPLGCSHAQKAEPAPTPPRAPAPAPVQPAPPQKIPGEAVLEQQPPVPPLSSFNAPAPKVVTLKNGLKIFIVEREGEGVEAIDLVSQHGSLADPPKLAGLA